MHTVLVADHSVTIQRVLKLAFSGQPFEIVIARDGQEAIDRMATVRPDIVLADVGMPCIDGYDVARWIGEQPRLHGVPVLLLAGSQDPVDEQRLKSSGADGVLDKPFEPTHVITRVKELLGIKGQAPATSTLQLTTPDITPRQRLDVLVAQAAQDAGDGPVPDRPGSASSPAARPASAVPPALDAFDVPVPETPASTGAGAATDFPSMASASSSTSLPPIFDVEKDWFGAAPPAASSEVDVFASLLAAEQGDQAAIAALDGATNAGAAQSARDLSLAARIDEAVREAVAPAVERAVAAAVTSTLPAAVAQAVSAAMGTHAREILRETSDRLVREEIARIRGGR